jgi:hypothetical protein
MKNQLSYEDAKKLLDAIFADEKNTEDMFHKALEWKQQRSLRLSSTDIVDAVEVAQMGFAEDMEGWDEMEEEEKDDLSLLMVGITFARELLANEFGMKSKFGEVEKR